MKYYVFNITNNSVTVLSNFQELIQWCSQFNYQAPEGTKNSLLENLALNFNDTKVNYRWDNYKKSYVPYLTPRKFIVFDEDNRIIDIRLYQKEIINYVSEKKEKKTYDYEFRNGPVPHIISDGKKRIRYFRHPHTLNEMKASADPEVQEFVRAKRRSNNLVNSWHEIPRHIDKCWKNKKIKRQWMKNLKC